MPPGGVTWSDFCFIAQEIPPSTPNLCVLASWASLSWYTQMGSPHLHLQWAPCCLLPRHMWMWNNLLLLLMQQRCKSYNQCLFCVCPMCTVGGIGSAWLMFCQQKSSLYQKQLNFSVSRSDHEFLTDCKTRFSLALFFLACYGSEPSVSKGLHYSASMYNKSRQFRSWTVK